MSDTELPEFDDRHKLVEKIDKRDLKPLYDTNHAHVYERDDDEADGYFAEMCVVQGCNLGRLVAKN